MVAGSSRGLHGGGPHLFQPTCGDMDGSRVSMGPGLISVFATGVLGTRNCDFCMARH